MLHLSKLLDANTVEALPPEELAAAILQTLNATSRDRIQFGSYCHDEAKAFGKHEAACAHAIAAALYYLAVTGMIAPTPGDSHYGWYFVTPRGRAVKSSDDYERYSADDDLYGVDLMKKAFHLETGNLTDKSEVSSERESLMHSFRSAIGRFKNPASHRELDLEDPAEVIEILGFASLLMRIVDRRTKFLGVLAAFPVLQDKGS